MKERHQIFVTGGTGYIGSRLIPKLVENGHQVTALVRSQSKNKLSAQCTVVTGNALDGASYSNFAEGAHTFIHLVGVSHPSPAKARQFIYIDQRSGLEAIRVAAEKKIAHFIYLSVAHPAPVMQAYINARIPCEQAIVEAGLTATILRPWYVLGPGHRWPYALIPLYAIARVFPGTRAGALRLGLVNVRQIVKALSAVVATPASGVRIVEVPEIRELARSQS